MPWAMDSGMEKSLRRSRARTPRAKQRTTGLSRFSVRACLRMGSGTLWIKVSGSGGQWVRLRKGANHATGGDCDNDPCSCRDINFAGEG